MRASSSRSSCTEEEEGGGLGEGLGEAEAEAEAEAEGEWSFKGGGQARTHLRPSAIEVLLLFVVKQPALDHEALAPLALVELRVVDL